MSDVIGGVVNPKGEGRASKGNNSTLPRADFEASNCSENGSSINIIMLIVR